MPVLGAGAVTGLYGKIAQRPSAASAGYGTTFYATDRDSTYVSTPQGWRLASQKWVGSQSVTRSRLLDDFADSTLWSFTTNDGAVAGTLGTTTDPDITGRNVMTVTSTSGVHTAVVRNLALDLTDRSLSIRLKADANLAGVKVHLVVQGWSFSKYFETTNAISRLPNGPLAAGEWIEVSIGGGDFDRIVGGVPRNALRDIRQVSIVAFPAAGTTTTLGLSQLRVHQQPLPPGVVLTFDDARLDTYTVAYPLLQAAGIKGHVYVPTGSLSSTLDSVPTASLAQMQDLVANGWSMGGHTHSHANLTSLTTGQVKTELESCYDYLLTNSLIPGGGSHFAYPFGATNPTVQAQTLQYFTTARGTHTRIASSAHTGTRGTLGIVDVSGSGVTAPLAACDLVAASGGVTVFMLHSVDRPAASVNISSANLQLVLNKISTLGLATYTLDDLFPV